MGARSVAKYLATTIPFALCTALAAWGLLVLPRSTGVKDLVVDGTCRQPHIHTSFSAQPYTGSLVIDKQLCILVEIFSQTFQPSGLRFMQHFLWGLPPFIMITLLEGARRDRPWFFRPLALGILYQLWTIGLTLSVVWAPFVIAFLRGSSRSRVSRTDVESALVATLIGYYFPTAAMLMTRSAVAIALWQPFPIYITIVQYIWSFLRSKGAPPPSFIGVRSALIFTIMTALAAQLYTLYPILNTITISSIKAWLPILTLPPGFKGMPANEGARGALQYDAFTAYISTIAAGVLMMESAGDALLWLVLAPAGMLLLSPAGYIGAMWIQRERKLSLKKID